MKRTVLVVDDDASFLRLMEHQLTAEGFNVLTTNDGSQAIDILRKSSVALVVTDMRMPLADGYDVVYWMKELYPTMPILLTTASAVNERVKKALQFESVVLLKKPFEISEFREAVKTLAARHSDLPSDQAA